MWDSHDMHSYHVIIIGWYIKGYEHYLDVIGQHVEVHGTLKVK